jgi:hypothetical protein
MEMGKNDIELVKMFYAILIYHKYLGVFYGRRD